MQELTLPPKADNADKARKVEGFSYIFPFDKVSKGERIVIYGAGTIGAQYLRQLAALDYCHVAAVADTYAKSGDTLEGVRCVTPEELDKGNIRFDRIVIASTTYHAQILGYLRTMGITPDRIV